MDTHAHKDRKDFLSHFRTTKHETRFTTHDNFLHLSRVLINCKPFIFPTLLLTDVWEYNWISLLPCKCSATHFTFINWFVSVGYICVRL